MKNNHQGPQIYFNKFCKLAEMQGGKVISEEKDYNCKKSASADGYQSWCKPCTNTLKKLNNILI